MITAIHFQNFKALRNATLPLGRFTLIVGPNGSGKSTAMGAFAFVAQPRAYPFRNVVSVGADGSVEVSIEWDEDQVKTMRKSEYAGGLRVTAGWNQAVNPARPMGPKTIRSGSSVEGVHSSIQQLLEGFRIFSFEAQAISSAVHTVPAPELGPNGSNLAAVLDALRDSEPERFEAINIELQRWLPEFDRILFETPQKGMKAFRLRTRVGKHGVPAVDLSHGTLFALALLTIAYLPSPPPIVCFEEPDHGIHPRLLNEIRDGMYRLAYPESFGETRPPVQVIATTHSPYLLDLYKEHPAEVVIAHKDAQGSHFQRLSEKPHLDEILEGVALGEIWFSGILGGVPANP